MGWQARISLRIWGSSWEITSNQQNIYCYPHSLPRSTCLAGIKWHCYSYLLYYFSVYTCWGQTETLKVISNGNLQCEWRWLLLRAKQQLSMSLNNVKNMEMFENELVRAAEQVWGNYSPQNCGEKKTEGRTAAWHKGHGRDLLIF